MNRLIPLGNEFIYENLISFGYYNEFSNLKLANKEWKALLDHPFFKGEDNDRRTIEQRRFKTYTHQYFRNGLYKLSSSGWDGTTDTYTGNKSDGYCLTINKYGMVETFIVKGNLEGQVKIYNSNRQLTKIQTYKNNKLNGLSIKYYPNGNIRNQTTYIDNANVGPLHTYSSDGTISSITTYKDGKIVSVTTM